MDVPLPVHGTDLFAPHGPGDHHSLGIFDSKRTSDLGRRYPGFDLGWMESRQLVSRAGDNCSCFVFAGRTDRWKKVMELSSQTIFVVCPRYDYRLHLAENLYR